MKIGIFFGGRSREREVSFAGGRTIFDNLDKSIFTPVPVFVDSLGNFILLDWQFLYKGTIRDFYPPSEFTSDLDDNYQYYIESLKDLGDNSFEDLVSKVGKKIEPHQFKQFFDFAFLTLHGSYGEEGTLQGLLDWYEIPYSGAGIFSSAFSSDKALQKGLFQKMGISTPNFEEVSLRSWSNQSCREDLFNGLKEKISFPLVIKSTLQGSSIGVNILFEDDFALFERYCNKAFFLEEISKSHWSCLDKDQKKKFIHRVGDIKAGLGFPIIISEKEIEVFHHNELFQTIEDLFQNSTLEKVTLSAIDQSASVLIEEFVEGREFSCIVLQDPLGKPVALPPTGINKHKNVFDYRAKYLPGIVRKQTPIDVSSDSILKIQTACEEMFEALSMQVYARIDGFLTEKGAVYLNDPNTTSGMMPSSFFFHQAAEVGLNPSQIISYIIEASLRERSKEGKNYFKNTKLLRSLQKSLEEKKDSENRRIKVGVIMGGYSSERHISMESGRNIYEKLASSTKYKPLPIFLCKEAEQLKLFSIPINLLLKDNADDIKDQLISNTNKVNYLDSSQYQSIVEKYVEGSQLSSKEISFGELSDSIDFAFIALHGRPGEDGELQKELAKKGIPFNGSNVASAQITIDKYTTKEILQKNGLKTAKGRLINKLEWSEGDNSALISSIESEFSYPLILKPSDDGCSSAVKKVESREGLESFMIAIFRDSDELSDKLVEQLQLSENEEFPKKEFFLLEEYITKEDVGHFLEVTCGLLTNLRDGIIDYTIFEPSEAVAAKGILSIEEKFLAGEGQNITPARFDNDTQRNAQISQIVKREIEKAAKVLNIEGYARVDAFVRIKEENVEVVFIEVNSLPGMTPATCIFHQAALENLTPYDFIDRIIAYGMESKKQLQTV